MAKDILKHTSASEDALDAANALCNSGTLQIWAGAKPTACEDAAVGTKVAEYNLDATAFGAAGPDASRAIATGNGFPKTDASTVAGTATYWRIYDAAGTTCIYQGDVSTTAADTGSVQFDDVVFQNGGSATVQSFTIYLDN